MKSYLASAVVALLFAPLCHAADDAKLQDIFYPTPDDALFVITAPEEWEIVPAQDVGEFFDLRGPTGAVFSFRTIKGDEDTLKEAINTAVEEANRDYTDVELSEAKEWTPNGLTGFYATGTAVNKKTKDPVNMAMGWVMLSQNHIAEVYFVAHSKDEEGMDEANTIANSLKAP